MLDLKLIRDYPDLLKNALLVRGQAHADVEKLMAELANLDGKRRHAITVLQDAQTRRNTISKQVGKAKVEKREADAQAMMAEIGTLKEAIAEAEAAERDLTAKLEALTYGIPNIPVEDVPIGGEESNQELRRWGTPPEFSFTPKQHFELGEALGLMDFEAAAKLSGSRFVVLKGALARLERAIGAFMLDLQTSEGGYTEVAPPLLVRDAAAFGTAQLPKFKEELFSARSVDFDAILEDAHQVALRRAMRTRKELMKIATELSRGMTDRNDILTALEAATDQFIEQDHDEELEGFENRLRLGDFTEERWLIPTAEVPLTNLVREQILEEASLPLRFAANTPCFRAEAGAAGRDTRGMIRLHQFSKVELVSITTPEQSAVEHERMTTCAEEVLKRLGLPYRTIVLATGDMGFSAHKTYDIEVWLPGQNAYREISSCSNCGDFQARRMSARYRPKGGKDVRFVHTLNGSGLAVGRTLIAVLENYQEEDGSIRIPEALVPYMGGMTGIVGKG